MGSVELQGSNKNKRLVKYKCLCWGRYVRRVRIIELLEINTYEQHARVEVASIHVNERTWFLILFHLVYPIHWDKKYFDDDEDEDNDNVCDRLWRLNKGNEGEQLIRWEQFIS